MAISKHEKKILKALIHEILLLRDKRCLKCSTTENLQASHIYSVGAYKKLEYDTDNIKFLCYKCHFHFWHKNPHLAWEWLQTVISKERLNRLKLRSQTTGNGMRDYKVIKLVLEKELKDLNEMEIK